MTDICVNVQSALHILLDAEVIDNSESGAKKGFKLLQDLKQPSKGYFKVIDIGKLINDILGD
jgi:hypothetical protein